MKHQQVGKYQLVRKLAKGGMAEVFLAKAAGPMGFEKTVVLKCILPELAEEPSFVQMFQSEAKLVARLTHPNIVQIFDFGEFEGAYFVAMEYVDGPSLRTVIKRAAAQELSLPPTVCARLISLACEGLAFAHDFKDPDTGEPLNIIHRDVSPDNILMSQQGAVKVVDFGIAKATGQSHKTESGVVKGKLPYMPPEQLRAKALDRRADVYALGVVLYELLTGQRPYSSESEAGLMQAILFEPPVPAAQFRPDLPQPLRRILNKALSKDRDQRYPDCHAFQVDLEAFIVSGGKPVMTQQVAQLINRANTDPSLPIFTPLSASALTPASPAGAPPAEPPFLTRKRPAASSNVAQTASLRMPQASMAQELNAPQAQQATQGTASMRAPAPSPSAGAPAVSRPVMSAAKPRSSNRWGPALVGGVLIALGGGVVSWRTSSEQGPRKPPPAVVKPAPGVANPAPGVVAPVPVKKAPDPVELPKPSVSPSPSVTRDPLCPPVKAPDFVAPARPGKLMGTVELRIQPYATVFVDGKRVGLTPLAAPLKLPEGRHTLKFVNEKLAKTVECEINVRAGANDLFKLSLLEE